MESFFELLASFLAVIVVVCLHEFAHAYVANKCGDPTPRLNGRLTLNPSAHFDPVGILAFALVGFGWAKPVPINPYNFKNYKRGCLLTSSAGIIVNYISAFLFFPLVMAVSLYVYPIFSGKNVGPFLLNLSSYLYTYSLCFCVFNLLPLYPLDGFRILDALNKKRGKVFRFLRDYGNRVLLIFIIISALADRIAIFAYIDVLGFLLSFANTILGYPITQFWFWILSLIV